MIIYAVNNFSDWLGNELDKRGWTRADLSRRAKITQSSLSMIVSGTRQPGSDLCEAIAHAFGYPPETVFRAAGILPPAHEDEHLERINYILSQLPPEKAAELIGLAEFFYERERNKKFDTKPKTRPAEG